MKSVIFAAAGFLAFAAPAFAQSTPSSNATSQGDATTSGNGAGAPSASTPAGKVATSGLGSAAPSAVPSMSGAPIPQAQAPTADSSTTGTTTAPGK